MKWIRVGLIVIAVLMGALVAFVYANVLRTANRVGFALIQVPDKGAASGGAPIPVALWYPTQAWPRPTTLLGLNLMSVAPDAAVAGSALPLIVISHGNAGGPGSHADLALALADAGFVVAAPMHAGDNYLDQSAAGTSRWLVDRNRHVRATLDYMLKDWPGHAQVNRERVGMFGFSAGGFTALATIGGEPDLRRIASQCAAAPEFVCRLLSESNSPLMRPENVPPATAFIRDPRVKAAVVAAPGLGFTFVPDGLRNVSVPVQLWSGQQDVNVPAASNTTLVSAALGARADLHSVPGAGHFSFLVPCRLLGPPFLCRDADGFDRAAFHAAMNTQVVGFFKKNL
jgi:predicted dienelactone hydrolase